MEKTREEVALRALRLIAVVAADEPATADAMNGALDVLDSLWAEVLAEAIAPWDIATGVPIEAFVPLANLLAAELAPEYGVAAPMSRARAKLRVLGLYRPDDGQCPREWADDYGGHRPCP